MAKKARFFLVTLKDVDRQWEEMIPAQSSDHARTEMESQYIRVIDIQSYGWHEVEVYDSSRGPAFYVKIGSNELDFPPGSAGYNYLSSQFHVQHRKIIDENYSDY
ncbi:hypothetical protein [Vibrio anguillarum]|uniref:hypothetical protein n=1 Tax=Vibrio anguillarum TaxID=55601 RepID=UPI00097E1A6B|nr:hypothetical protein [Vibrio anguillarum]AQM20544.1 hypothetical protein PN51_12435 [Vibrio anguillarum]AUB88920.1 hypothetical protein CKY00_16935 [Vibrio anguillarum]AUB92360.1 hypothetical protein CKX99_16950 [Vibrio anguillarum]AUB95795.1 hypothetical protein CK210_16940 [Vibrio anguillarum]AUB99216.1 hypothetical protein CK209_16865 [Vibrio anguillarum]